MQRVAVVGAGLAGLTCAQTLKAAGCEMVVFEKSRGPGGRLSTRRTATAQYDHGAPYFPVQDPRFAAFIEARLADGSVAVWTPKVQGFDASDRATWYVGTPGMSALGRAQAQGLDLRLEQRVASLARRGSRWQIKLEDESMIDGFDTVVIAVPNAQAVPLLAEHAPQWASQLEQTPMNACWTVMFSTAEPLTEFDADQPADNAIGWWLRNSSKPGRPVTPDRHDWVLHATDAWTTAHLDDDKAQVGQVLIQAFGDLLGKSVTPIEAPMVHRWLYARRSGDAQPLVESWWRSDLSLGVCGDGLGHGGVERAYLSGLDVGQAILRAEGQNKEKQS